MKFPIEKGIAIILGDQSMARMCYVQGVDGKGKGKMVSTVFQLGDKLPCKIEEGGTFGELDQRDDVERRKVETTDDLVPVVLGDAKPDQVVKVRAQLPSEVRTQLAAFLRDLRMYLRGHTPTCRGSTPR